MVVSLSALFFLSLLFAPKKGLVKRYLMQQQLRQKVSRENILRTLYKLWERSEFQQNNFNISDIQALRAMPTLGLRKTLKHLCRQGLLKESTRGFRLSDLGLEQATQLTRRHRLWENYLNEHLALTPDQVHSQAERIEHILTLEQEKQLEEELKNSLKDPHGNQIPGAQAQIKTPIKPQGKAI